MSLPNFDYDFTRGCFYKNEGNDRCAVLIPTSDNRIDAQSVLLFEDAGSGLFHQLLINGLEDVVVDLTVTKRLRVGVVDIVNIKDPANTPKPSDEVALEADTKLAAYCGFWGYNCLLQDDAITFDTLVFKKCPPFTITDGLIKKFNQQQLEWFKQWNVRIEDQLTELF